MYKIYGVSDCPYCLRAQALCMEKGIEYVWVNMDWSKAYRERQKELLNWKTYPIITTFQFDDSGAIESLIGGFDELQLELLSLEQQHIYYVEKISPGDLVKWIIDYKVFEAGSSGEVMPVDAVWATGIIIEVSNNDPLSVVLVRLDDNTYQTLHMIHDGFQIISKSNGD